MPEYRHPTTLDGVPGKAPARVHVTRAEAAAVTGGTFDAPESVGEAVAARFGVDVPDIRVGGTCETIKSDGEVCGRDLPCSYHTEG